MPSSSTRKLVRMALLIALSVVGAMIKIPSFTGTVAFDSLPGYYAALAFGWQEGAVVAALGHLISAATAGFPLSLPLHLYIAAQMALYAIAFGLAGRFIGLPVAVVVGTILNGIVAPALFIPLPQFGKAFFSAMVVPLLVASAANVLVAAAIFAATGGRRKRYGFHD